MDGQIKPVDLDLFADTQRSDRLADHHQHNGHHSGIDTDNRQRPQLCGPGPRPEGSDHDGAEDTANAVNREYVKRVVDLGLVADQDDRFLAQDPGNRADEKRLDPHHTRSNTDPPPKGRRSPTQA